MLKLNLMIEGVTIALGEAFDLARLLAVEQTTKSLCRDFDSYEPIQIQQLRWWEKLFSNAKRGETIHKISNCDIEILNGIHFLPIGIDSPFGASQVWIEVFTSSDIVTKVNMYDASQKRMKHNLLERPKLLLQEFNTRCTQTFGSPLVLSDRKTSPAESDQLHIWQDDDSCIKSTILHRTFFVMWETVPRS